MRTKTPAAGSAALPLAQESRPGRGQRKATEVGKRRAVNAWDEIAKLAGCIEGPEDLAENFDHYRKH